MTDTNTPIPPFDSREAKRRMDEAFGDILAEALRRILSERDKHALATLRVANAH